MKGLPDHEWVRLLQDTGLTYSQIASQTGRRVRTVQLHAFRLQLGHLRGNRTCRRFSNDTVELFRALYLDGAPLEQIRAMTGMSQRTCGYYRARLGLQARHPWVTRRAYQGR